MFRSWVIAAAVAAAQQSPAIDYAGDAKALDDIVVKNYAYEDHWPGGTLPDSPALAKERAGVHDVRSLLHYAEHRMASLADHHAVTGSSFKDSWAIIPSYSDLWIELRGGDYVITAVRDDSPAASAHIRNGDLLTKVDGVAIAQAVGNFWRELGLGVTEERAAYAARVLAAGRRDRPRSLTVARSGTEQTISLPNLYGRPEERVPLTTTRSGGRTVIRFNNSLGDQATITAFDSAMGALPRNSALLLDLRDTPSGGNTSVARAIMSWFVDRPRSYQVHRLPAEERDTGIARQWIEQVLPRPGKRHFGPPLVLVGRWTGSMGEGLAIGFDAIGARVVGTRMAGLRGAVYDERLPHSGLVLKLPAERVMTVAGQPREAFAPRRR